jgi:transcription elongation GreA/GreB family factor
MNKMVGDVVVVQRPMGELEIEVVEINYEGG